MKKLERIILIMLTLGVWAAVGTLWLKPNNVAAQKRHTHNVSQVYGAAKDYHSHKAGSITDFSGAVRRAVSSCTVDSGDIKC